MGMSLHVVAVDDAALAGWSSEEAMSALLAGWSADQFGWAVGGLLCGESGIVKFGHSATDRFGAEVQVMRPLALESLVTDMPDTCLLYTSPSPRDRG